MQMSVFRVNARAALDVVGLLSMPSADMGLALFLLGT